MIIKKLLFTIITFSFFLLLLSSMGVAQEDFKATTIPSVELCPCSNQAYMIAVENTGNVASSYLVLADKDLSEWVAFSPNRFTLQPGQKGSFSVIVNSDCNIEGSFDLEVFIATNAGLAKSLKQELNFLECYDYSLQEGEITDADDKIKFIAHNGSYELCENEQKAIPILVTNNENFANIYKLKMDAPKWASLNANEVQLNAKSSGVLLINYGAINVEGEFKFKIDAISRLGEVQKKKSIDADVGECYALDIEIEKDKDVVCGGEENAYDISVKNSGDIDRNIVVGVEGHDWASIENGSLYLESEQEKTLKLKINPENDVSGNFLVEVFSVANNKTGLRFSDTISLDVVPSAACYQAKIDAKDSVKNSYSRDFISARIKNNGIRNANYSVSVDGPSWVNAAPKNLELKPKQSGNVNLEINPNSDVEESAFDIKLNIEGNGQIYSKDIKVNVKKESEFVRKLKSAFRFYQYYIYLFLAIFALVIIFRKQIRKTIGDIKKRYEKYNVRKERLAALKAAREEREKKKEEEQKRKEEQERKEGEKRKGEEIKKQEIKKALKKAPRKAPKKFSSLKILIYALIIIVAIIVALIFIGHQSKLFNAKYLYIYIINFFVSYLYYILIGVGAVVVMFLLLLLYNFVTKKGKRKVKKEEKISEKKAKKKIKRKIPYFTILIVLIVAVLIAVVNLPKILPNINLPNINNEILGNARDFFVLYQYYFLLGIAILIAIIFLIRFYKPLFKFLRE